MSSSTNRHEQLSPGFEPRNLYGVPVSSVRPGLRVMDQSIAQEQLEKQALPRFDKLYPSPTAQRRTVARAHLSRYNLHGRLATLSNRGRVDLQSNLWWLGCLGWLIVVQAPQKGLRATLLFWSCIGMQRVLEAARTSPHKLSPIVWATLEQSKPFRIGYTYSTSGSLPSSRRSILVELQIDRHDFPSPEPCNVTTGSKR